MFSKQRFIVLNKKWILLFFCFLFVVASVVVYFTAIRPTVMPKAEHVIVIDAGHGGLECQFGAVGGVKKSISGDMRFLVKFFIS